MWLGMRALDVKIKLTFAGIRSCQNQLCAYK